MSLPTLAACRVPPLSSQNGEHGTSTAYSEFVNTSNVSVYGCKSEGSGAVIFVRDSDSFASYSHSGLANANGHCLGPRSRGGQIRPAAPPDLAFCDFPTRSFRPQPNCRPLSPGYYKLPPDQCDGMAPCPWQGSLYRIVNCTNTRFVNVMSV